MAFNSRTHSLLQECPATLLCLFFLSSEQRTATTAESLQSIRQLPSYLRKHESTCSPSTCKHAHIFVFMKERESCRLQPRERGRGVLCYTLLAFHGGTNRCVVPPSLLSPPTPRQWAGPGSGGTLASSQLPPSLSERSRTCQLHSSHFPLPPLLLLLCLYPLLHPAAGLNMMQEVSIMVAYNAHVVDRPGEEDILARLVAHSRPLRTPRAVVGPFP